MTKVASSKTSSNSTDAVSMDVSAAPFEASVGKLLKRLSLPGLDIDAILDAQFRDFEALSQATQQVRKSLDTLADRQGELLMSAMYQFQTRVKDQAGSVSGRAKQATQVLDGALRSMRELTELTAQSHRQAFSTLSGRVQERLTQLGKPA